MDEATIYKFFSGQLSGNETRELLTWVQKEESNKKYFSELKSIWTTLQLHNENPEYTAQDEFSRLSARIQLQQALDKRKVIQISPLLTRQFFRRIFLPVAASILFLLGFLGILSIYRQNNPDSYNEILTQRGEKSLITLADGTRIWLNSQTTLRYPSRADRKKVKVFLEGEAFFDVAKQKGRTFIVQASTLEIAALGTSFNVKSYRDEGIIETTVEEGKISITGKIGSKELKQPVLLTPNMQATFSKGSQEYHIEPIQKEEEESRLPDEVTVQKTKPPAGLPELILSEQVDTRLYSAWKDGKLVFRSECFEELALRMERWYDVQIMIEDQGLKDKKYTGTFEKETIEQALKALSLSMPFYYTIDQNRITIRKIKQLP